MDRIMKSAVAALALPLLAAGCASLNGADNASPAAAQSARTATGGANGCSAGLGAELGAVASTLINGGHDKGDAGRLARLACMAYSHRVAQIKSAGQVEAAYRKAHGGHNPNVTLITRFVSGFAPGAAVAGGGKTTLLSYVEVVPSRWDVALAVEQEVKLYSPDGRELVSMRKFVNENDADGGFLTAFTFNLPGGVPQGVYPIRTTVYVNKQPVKSTSRTFNLQVVWRPSRQMTEAVAMR